VPRFLAGRETPRDYLEACLATIAAREPEVMAFAFLNEAGAREAADAATIRYRAGAPLSPIDGMPIGIKDLIETRVRPAVANDGGDIIYRGFQKGVVFLQMQGACAGCPSSSATLKNGIEQLLKHYVPEVTEVRAA